MAHGIASCLPRARMLALACACLVLCVFAGSRPVAAAATTTAAVPSCNPCSGVDVSQFQGAVNWNSWKASGRVFAYIRATDGTSIIDSEFSTNYTAAYRAGIIRGAYTFADPRQAGGAAEADFFVAHGGRWSADGLTLPGALDFETGTTVGSSECWGMSAAQIESWVRAFADEYHARTTRWPVIYFNAAFWTDCTHNYAGFSSSDPLWVADVGVNSPVTDGWPFWTFWQYGQSGTDLDRFNGSGARLVALANNTSGSTPAPAPPRPTSPATATPTPRSTATPTPTPRSTSAPAPGPRSTSAPAPTSAPPSTPAAAPPSSTPLAPQGPPGLPSTGAPPWA